MGLPYSNELRGEVGRLIFAYLIISFSSGSFGFSLPYYIPHVLGLPGWIMGVIITVSGLTGVVLSWPFGYLSDRYGRRRIYALGGLFSSAAMVMIAYASNFEELVMAAVISGFSGAMLGSSYNALLADKASGEARTRAFSLSFFVGTLGMAGGGFILKVLHPLEAFTGSSLEAHRLFYLAMAGLTLASPALTMTVSPDVRRERKMVFMLPKRSVRYLAPYLVSSALIAFGAGMVVPLMTYWFSLKFFIDDAVSGPILGFSMLLTAISFLLSPKLASIFGHVKAIVLTQASSTLFLVLLPFSPTYLIAGILFSVRTLLMNVSNPLATSLIMSLVDERERGLASGISSAFWRLPNSLSSYFGAYIMGAGMVDAPFFICTVLYIISISYFWIKFRGVKIPSESGA